MNLNIDVAARFAQVTDALNAIAGQAERAGNRMDKAFSAVKTTLQTLGLTLTVGAITAFIKSTIDAADKLNDLSKRSGIAVETLGGIGFAAQQSGIDLETLTVGLDKLNKSIAEAKAGNKEKLAVFEALHIDVANIKSADDAIVQIAGKFENYADGANKVALANALGGKSFAAFIPFFDEGAEAIAKNIEYFRRFSGITQDTTSKADQFNDTMDKLHLLQKAMGNTIAEKLLPFLQRLADAWVDAKEKGSGFQTVATAIDGAIKGLASTAVLASTAFGNIGRNLGGLAVQLQLLDEAASNMGKPSANPLGAIGQLLFGAKGSVITEETKAALRAIKGIQQDLDAQGKQSLDDMADSLDRILGRGKYAEHPLDIEQAKTPQRTRGARPDAPGIPDQAALAKLDAARKAYAEVVEAQSKFVVDAEKDAAKSRLEVLDHFYKEGFADEERYWAVRQEIQQRAYQAEAKAFDQNVSTRREEQARALKQNGAGSVEYYNATKELTQAMAQRNKLDSDYASQGNQDVLNRAKATAEYERAIKGVNAQLLDLAGKTAEASKMRRDLESEPLRNQARSRDDLEGEIQIKNLDELLSKQDRFNELRDRAREVTDRLALQEERIQNAVRIGAKSDIEATLETDQARKNAVQTLKLTRRELDQLANTPGLEKLAIDAERFGSALDTLESQSNTLADRARTTLSEGFVDAFSAFREELLSSGKILDALGKAFSRFALRIEQEIENIAAKNLAQALFGNDSSVVNLFSKLLGGAVSGSTSTLAAASPNSGFEEGRLLGSFATGTDYVPQTGLYRLHQGEAVIPAAQNGSGPTLVQNIRVDSRSDASTIGHSMQVAKVQALAAMEDLSRRRPRR
jgi:hypothetical protein